MSWRCPVCLKTCKTEGASRNHCRMKAADSGLTEQQIQQQCLQWLNLQPKTRCWRRNVGGMTGEHKGKSWFVRFGTAGMADIEGISNGRHVEIEIKRPGKRPTMVQEAWLDQMAYLGAVAFWCMSLDELERKWREAQ